jgi:fluoroquinolone transport system ATP-binding protein
VHAVIEVDGLDYRYPGARADTLHGLSFDVRRGEIFGFLGPSGAGKSTTQRILTGLLPARPGSVRVFDADVAAHGRGYYERIGVGFETPNVYGQLTGRENLHFFGSLYARATTGPETLLAQVGLLDAADQRVATWSKGMRMRLNFCRALLCSPELLFLDEPTTGQDPENARRLKQIIRAQRDAGSTVFLTTHDMATAAELCDRVAFLVAGRIAVIDTPRALMVRHGERRVRVEHVAADAVQARVFDLDGLADNGGFLDLLRSGSVLSMHTLDATLEDVFVAVTGTRLS